MINLPKQKDPLEVWGSSPREPIICFNHLEKITRKLHL
jgi:hypothetical protein